MSIRILTVVFVAVAALACDAMESISQITKFRVMGVQADPPEIHPGHGTVLRVLFADPKGEGRDVQILWANCLGAFSPSADLEDGCESVWAPMLPTSASAGGDTYTIPMTPSDVLADLPEGEDHLKVTAIVVLCAGGEFSGLDAFSPTGEIRLFEDLCRGGDGLVAVKTFRISNGTQPNLNPEIRDITFEGESMVDDPDAGPLEYQCEESSGCRETVDIEGFLTSDSYQSYTKFVFDKEKFVDENPFISWFITGGKFTEDRSRAADPAGPISVEWKPPRNGGVFTLWAVAHDERGGVSWKSFPVKAVLPTESEKNH